MKTLKNLIIVSIFMIVNKSYAATIIINQAGSSFSPKNVSVNVGDVIRWVWSSGEHTTTSTSVPQGAEIWDSPLNSTSPIVEYTVSVAGTYDYVCIIHQSMGMTGSFTASVANSVEEQFLENYKLYPNPTSGLVSLPSSINGKFKVFDILGNEIIDSNTGELSGANGNSLDVSELSQGMYFISFFPENSRRRFTWKFLKK